MLYPVPHPRGLPVPFKALLRTLSATLRQGVVIIRIGQTPGHPQPIREGLTTAKATGVKLGVRITCPTTSVATLANG